MTTILIWLNKVNDSLREGRCKPFFSQFFLFFNIFKKLAGYNALFAGIFKKSNLLEFKNYPMFAGAKWPFFWYNFL